MMNSKYFMLFTFIFFLAVTACKEDEPEIPGGPPVADAGPDLDGTVGSSVTLDGSGSSDPDGDNLSYVWSITTSPSGSSASVSNATSATASFVPDVAGTYTVQLSVDDGNYDPVTDEATVTVEESVGNPPIAIIRDEDGREISEDNENNTVTITTPYVLDGSNSTDPDVGDELTFAWTVTEQPDGSNPEIKDNDQEVATFVPDVPGEYIIQLEVKDQNDNMSTATATIVADANPVVIDSNIDADTELPNIFDDPELADYLVTADIGINANLTVKPGVKVLVETDHELQVNSEGALIAKGKADSLIVFTADDTENGWRGIIFFSTNVLNELDYVEVSYGGSSDVGSGIPKAAISVEFADKVKITNSIVSDSKGYGMFVEDGGIIEAFANNTFKNNADNPLALPVNQLGKLDDASTFSEGNADNSVEIFGSTINQGEVQTFPAIADGTPYYVTGDLIVSSGVEIMAGATFEFDPSHKIDVRGEGYLTAKGTETDSIIFTARSQENGWEGIVFFSSDVRNELAYTRVSYGGSAAFGSGVLASNVGVEFADKVKITNSVLSHSKGDYGLYVESGGFLEEFSNNRFENNENGAMAIPVSEAGKLDAASTFSGNGDNSVEIIGSTLNVNDTQTWPAFTDGTPYYISGDVILSSGCVIEAGATLEFKDNTKLDIRGDGFLTAVGTADDRITFTARNQSDGWDGIVFFSNLASNKLIYTTISYGGANSFGSGVDAANVGVEFGDKVAIANSEITNSKAVGVFVESGGTATNADGTTMTTLQDFEDAGNTFSDNTSGEVTVE